MRFVNYFFEWKFSEEKKIKLNWINEVNYKENKFKEKFAKEATWQQLEVMNLASRHWDSKIISCPSNATWYVHNINQKHRYGDDSIKIQFKTKFIKKINQRTNTSIKSE